jgi:hypothetical protein
MLWIMGGPGMHHKGYMALHHMVQGMIALNLTWFQGERGTIKSSKFKSKSLDFWEERHGQNH